jgi:hypothetical protein
MTTRADLERWEQSGAIWRVRSVTDEEATVELCTCSGETVELVRATDPATLQYLAERRSSDGPD